MHCTVRTRINRQYDRRDGKQTKKKKKPRSKNGEKKAKVLARVPIIPHTYHKIIAILKVTLAKPASPSIYI